MEPSINPSNGKVDVDALRQQLKERYQTARQNGDLDTAEQILQEAEQLKKPEVLPPETPKPEVSLETLSDRGKEVYNTALSEAESLGLSIPEYIDYLKGEFVAARNSNDLETAKSILEKAEVLKGKYKDPMSTLESAWIGFQQGATFGFSDELKAIAKAGVDLKDMNPSDVLAVVSGPIGLAIPALKTFVRRVANDQLDEYLSEYRKVRDDERDNIARAEVDNPDSYLAGEVTGAIATSAIPGGIASKAAGASLKSALATGAAGGTYAAGKSRADLTRGEVGEFAKDTATGAATGALTVGLVKGAAAGNKILDKQYDILAKKISKSVKVPFGDGRTVALVKKVAKEILPQNKNEAVASILGHITLPGLGGWASQRAVRIITNLIKKQLVKGKLSKNEQKAMKKAEEELLKKEKSVTERIIKKAKRDDFLRRKSMKKPVQITRNKGK